MFIDRLSRRPAVAVAARIIVFVLLVLTVSAPSWAAQAARVTITRDDWGIAHVKGKTDADGNLRKVYFYPDELAGHVERSYRLDSTHPQGSVQ